MKVVASIKLSKSKKVECFVRGFDVAQKVGFQNMPCLTLYALYSSMLFGLWGCHRPLHFCSFTKPAHLINLFPLAQAATQRKAKGFSYIKNIFYFSVKLTRGIEKMGCEADLSVSQLKTVAESIQTLAYSSVSAGGKNKARD